MITNQELRQMAKEYLANGDFGVSGAARIEKAGLEWLAEEGDVEQEDINYWISNRQDYDGLSDWACELAIETPLIKDVFLFKTLDVSDREQRLCYQAEMSADEQARFIALYRKMFDTTPDWL